MGIILGTLLIYIGSITGFNMTGIEVAGTTFTQNIYTVFRPRQFLLYPVLIILFTAAVSSYPAHHAGKMPITHALRKTL